MYVTFLLILVLILVTDLKANNCKITCEKNDRVIIQNFQSKQELTNIANQWRYSSKTTWDIRNFTIDGGLPRNIFVGTSLKKIFLRDFFLRRLSERNESSIAPFHGLENTLTDLIVLNPLNGVTWKWNELANLTKLERLVISHGAFLKSQASMLLDNFPLLNGKSLQWLQVTGGCMSKLLNGILKNFTALKYLNLQGNQMSDFNRNALPDYPILEYIDLSNNKITALSEDAFQNMVYIKEISLENNRLQDLQPSYFLPLINKKINVYGNNIFCDSSIMWLVKAIDIFEDGTRPLMCSKPEATLGGKEIRSLTFQDVMPRQKNPPILLLPANYMPLHICTASGVNNQSNNNY